MPKSVNRSIPIYKNAVAFVTSNRKFGKMEVEKKAFVRTNPNFKPFLERLSSKAKVITASDPGYTEALVRWAENAIKPAGLIVQVANTQDVSETVCTSRKLSIGVLF